MAVGGDQGGERGAAVLGLEAGAPCWARACCCGASPPSTWAAPRGGHRLVTPGFHCGCRSAHLTSRAQKDPALLASGASCFGEVGRGPNRLPGARPGSAAHAAPACPGRSGHPGRHPPALRRGPATALTTLPRLRGCGSRGGAGDGGGGGGPGSGDPRAPPAVAAAARMTVPSPASRWAPPGHAARGPRGCSPRAGHPRVWRPGSHPASPATPTTPTTPSPPSCQAALSGHTRGSTSS